MSCFAPNQRVSKMHFIAHVRTHSLPPNHELEAMIVARQVPRKFIGLARKARAALDEAEALLDGDPRRDELIDVGDDIVGKYFLGLLSHQLQEPSSVDVASFEKVLGQEHHLIAMLNQ
jgi:hypothetical protein